MRERAAGRRTRAGNRGGKDALADQDENDQLVPLGKRLLVRRLRVVRLAVAEDDAADQDDQCDCAPEQEGRGARLAGDGVAIVDGEPNEGQLREECGLQHPRHRVQRLVTLDAEAFGARLFHLVHERDGGDETTDDVRVHDAHVVIPVACLREEGHGRHASDDRRVVDWAKFIVPGGEQICHV